MGCVAYLRPTGEWNEPVDLDLDATSLAGTNATTRPSFATCSGSSPRSEHALRTAADDTAASLLQALRMRADDSSEMVREHVAWALAQAQPALAFSSHQQEP